MCVKVEDRYHNVIEASCDTLDCVLNRLRAAGYWPRVVLYEWDTVIVEV